MKLTKILVALSFLFAISTANAGEMTVTGNMEATYHTQPDQVTGNPIGMDRELKFSGSTELDNGITVSVMQDTDDSLTYGNSQISFGNVAGLATIYVGSDSDPMDSIDDLTPTAYEEANGSGSGTYVDVSGGAGQMGIGAKFDLPVLGAVNIKHYPKEDSDKNGDNTSSENGNAAVGSGMAVSLTTNLADLPVLGSYLDGAKITTGLYEFENQRIANSKDELELTAALNYSAGSFALGYQKKFNDQGATAAAGETISYTDDIWGISYAVNDALSISYNRYQSKRSDNRTLNELQETDAFNIGYTIGGMTIGFQEASTDNANYTLNSEDDTRTIGVSVAF